MYEMTSNVLSINHKTVISQPKFKRLNDWFRKNDIKEIGRASCRERV